MSKQLTLNISLRDGLRFSSFYYNDENSQTYFILKAFSEATQQIGIQQLLLSGESKSGKSHLLQACCYQLAEQGLHASYLPLKVLLPHGTKILSGLHHSDLIVIDDVDTVLGDTDWEEALFNLISQARIAGQRLLLSSTKNPSGLKCYFSDLLTHLVWGSLYQLSELREEDMPYLLQFRAKQRGFTLNDKVIDYIYKRYPHNMASLLEILDKLDRESLQKKAKITIPFVKQVLKEESFNNM